MKAAFYTIEINQGKSFKIVLVCKGADKLPIDVSAFTTTMNIKETYTSTSALASSAGTSPIISIANGGALGTLTITITATNTTTLAFDSAVYDIELTNSGTGEVIPILYGNVVLFLNV